MISSNPHKNLIVTYATQKPSSSKHVARQTLRDDESVLEHIFDDQKSKVAKTTAEKGFR